MLWKMFGTYDNKQIHVCTIEAESFDEAIEKARNSYGSLFITGAQPL